MLLGQSGAMMNALVAIAVAAALAIAPIPARADPLTLRSHTADASGKCTGQDQVAILTPPWERSPITLRAASVSGIVQWVGYPVALYVFAGNSFTPDQMTGTVFGAGADQGAATAAQTFPADAGMPLDTAPGSHIDAHLWCLPVGAAFQVSETVWYTIP